MAETIRNTQGNKSETEALSLSIKVEQQRSAKPLIPLTPLPWTSTLATDFIAIAQHALPTEGLHSLRRSLSRERCASPLLRPHRITTRRFCNTDPPIRNTHARHALLAGVAVGPGGRRAHSCPHPRPTRRIFTGQVDVDANPLQLFRSRSEARAVPWFALDLGCHGPSGRSHWAGFRSRLHAGTVQATPPLTRRESLMLLAGRSAPAAPTSPSLSHAAVSETACGQLRAGRRTRTAWEDGLPTPLDRRGGHFAVDAAAGCPASVQFLLQPPPCGFSFAIPAGTAHHNER